MPRDSAPGVGARRDQDPGRKAKIAWLRMALDLIAMITMTFLLLTIAWLRLGVAELVDRYASNVSANLVLRTDSGGRSPEGMIREIESRHPSLQIRLISEAELRGMLALQDSWMSKLPDVSISAIPVMAEVRPRNPDVASSDWLGDLDSLRVQPETDFVIYDDARAESMRQIRTNVEWYSQTIGTAFAAIAVIVILTAAGVSAARLRHFLLLIFVRSVVLGFLAAGLGYGSFRILTKAAATRFALADLASRQAFGICALVIGLWVLGAFAVSIMVARPPQYRAPQ